MLAKSDNNDQMHFEIVQKRQFHRINKSNAKICIKNIVVSELKTIPKNTPRGGGHHGNWSPQQMIHELIIFTLPQPTTVTTIILPRNNKATNKSLVF